MVNTAKELPMVKASRERREKNASLAWAKRAFIKAHGPGVNDDIQKYDRHTDGAFRITVTPESVSVAASRVSSVRLDIVDRNAPQLEWLAELYKEMTKGRLSASIELERLTKRDTQGKATKLWVAHVTITEPGSDR